MEGKRPRTKKKRNVGDGRTVIPRNEEQSRRQNGMERLGATDLPYGRQLSKQASKQSGWGRACMAWVTTL